MGGKQAGVPPKQSQQQSLCVWGVSVSRLLNYLSLSEKKENCREGPVQVMHCECCLPLPRKAWIKRNAESRSSRSSLFAHKE